MTHPELPPDVVAGWDQRARQVGDLLDQLVDSQRPNVALYGAENAIHVGLLAMAITENPLEKPHLADLLALAIRRLAAVSPEANVDPNDKT